MHQLKNSRGGSFALLAVIYAVATALGVVTYRLLPLPWWLALLAADLAATVFTFVFSLIFSNASVYDPYWSVQPPVILAAFAVGRGLTAFGVLLTVAVSYWALRLTANWVYTFRGLCHQDWRYTMLKERTGAFYPLINFLGIHTVPTLVVYGCVLPAVFAIRHGLTGRPVCLLFLCLSVAAATLQGVADVQMHRFRRHPTGAFIRTGLWTHSRHPNYLGEILMWWGVALSVVAAQPAAWYLCAGAVANTVLFLTVSIPLADGRQSRKEGFAAYKEGTRALWPLPRHKKG